MTAEASSGAKGARGRCSGPFLLILWKHQQNWNLSLGRRGTEDPRTSISCCLELLPGGGVRGVFEREGWPLAGSRGARDETGHAAIIGGDSAALGGRFRGAERFGDSENSRDSLRGDLRCCACGWHGWAERGALVPAVWFLSRGTEFWWSFGAVLHMLGRLGGAGGGGGGKPVQPELGEAPTRSSRALPGSGPVVKA